MNGLIYLTYNSAEQISKNLKSVLSAKQKLSIVCIDNASEDNSVELLEKVGANVRRNETNVGFSKAINQGIEILLEKDCEWIFIINPDIQCPEGYDELLLSKKLTSHHGCGIIGSRTVDYKGSISYAGGFIGHPQLVYWPTKHDLGNGKLLVQQDVIAATRFRARDKDNDVIEQVPWVRFYSTALRSEMIRDVGLLDEKYFLYCSDSEFCVRAKQKGWEVWYNPVDFIHDGSINMKRAGNDIQLLAQADLKMFARLENDLWQQLLDDSPR